MRPCGDWLGLNVAAFHLVNGAHAPWWDALMLAMTWLGRHDHFPVIMAVVLLASYARPAWISPRAVVVFAVGYVLSGAVVATLKPVLDCPRPVLALGREAVVVVAAPQVDHSFPSGHATFAVLLAVSLSRGASGLIKTALWLFAGFVCLSRVSLGAHFPADVAGGAALGAATAVCISTGLRAWSTGPPAGRRGAGV